jgi:UDP-N-acetylmuramoyl-tripeptide--D-alanyl-D-alanine ligase
MTLWSAKDAALATGGKAQGAWDITGVSIDTRTLQAGDLFVALKDIRDGHDFVAQALENGAAAALVSHIPQGVSKDAPLLIVKDVLTALEDLGRAARARTRAKVVAVTGSVGKTSTKEMLREILSPQGKTHCAEASYNNHWGVPLTLARMPQDADFAVIEIGMNHPGEIAPLSKMARPDVALITTVAVAHLEAFDDISGIAREKGAIFEGLREGGVAIINDDLEASPVLRACAKGFELQSFGENPKATHQLTHVSLTFDATICKACICEEEYLFKIATPGRHFATNGLAALVAARALGADVTLAARDMVNWLPPAGRGTKETITLHAAEDLTLTLIDDAFNANPTSMAAALEVLSVMQPTDGVGEIHKGRRIAVLGDMLELGPDEIEIHSAIAEYEFLNSIDQLHCVGPRMKSLWQALSGDQQGLWVQSADEMAAKIHKLLDAGDVVLVKGSKGSKVSQTVDAIRKMGQSHR